MGVHRRVDGGDTKVISISFLYGLRIGGTMSQVPHFKCPHCGQLQGTGSPPNFTTISAPSNHGAAVVVLSCRNPACQAVIGSYPYELRRIDERSDARAA